MKRNSLFTKIAALMLCVMMVIGCLPMSAFAEWEGGIDAVAIDGGKLSVLGDGDATGDNKGTLYSAQVDITYKWTAIGKGTLSITMPQYIGWSYSLKVGSAAAVTGTYANGNTIEATVAEGDAVVLTVTFNGTTPSMEVNVQAAFDYADGAHASKPIYLQTAGYFSEPVEGVATSTETFSVPANSTVYYNIQGSRWQTIVCDATVTGGNENSSIIYTVTNVDENGEEVTETYDAVDLEDYSLDFMGIPFAVVNNGSEDVEYTVTLTQTYAKGTQEYPDSLKVGTEAPLSNTATYVASSMTTDGNYVYSWTAVEDGILTIDMGASLNWALGYGNGWSMSYVYASEKVSVIEIPVVASTTYTIVVSAEDFQAGSTTFTAAFSVPVEEPEETDPPATEEPVETTPVAEITVDGVTTKYGTVAEALNAATSGQTVTMTANSGTQEKPEGTLIIKPYVTLNLGSNTLYAEYVVGLKNSAVYGAYFNGASSSFGKLYVNKDNISLAATGAPRVENEGYVYIPVWYNAGTKNVDTDDYYVFCYSAIVEKGLPVKKADNNGSVAIEFNAMFNGKVRTDLLRDGNDNGLDDSDITVSLVVSFVADGLENTTRYRVTKELQYETCLGSKNGSIKSTVIDCEAYGDVYITIMIETATGLVISTDTYSYRTLA